MKTKISIVFLTIILVTILSCSKSSKEDKELNDQLTELDKSKGEFKPDYFTDASKAHYAVVMKVVDGNMTMDSSQTSMRPGRLPFAVNEKSSLPFKVSYKDANGKIIGSYSFDDPSLVRSCDDGKGFSTRTTYTFEILLPADKNISTFDISMQDKKLNEFSVRGFDFSFNRNINDTIK